MSAGDTTFYASLAVLGYLVGPGMLLWGWARWIKQKPRDWKVASISSFIGFLLANASALFALSIVVFAGAGGFGTEGRDYYPDYGLLYRCIGCGALLSTAGIVFAVVGVWRPNSVRWQSLASAVGTLAFWLLATTWQ